MRKFFTQFLIILIVVAISFHCAGQIYPPGGPPDSTPPEIITSFPAPGTLQFNGDKFQLEFSEYVDKRSVEESIFLSPSLGKLEFDWSGTEVEIQFQDSLRSNTTYIMTLGTDVKDTKEKGNRMAEAFSLPFSTGNQIDSASISGNVFDANADGIMVFAYRIDIHHPDSVNPATLKPDFLTQTGKDGSFRLPYLAYGTYRLMALRDEYKNLLYDRQVDSYGIFTHDICLTSDSMMAGGIQFLLTKEDTSAPFLSSARAIDHSHMLLRFSEAIDTFHITAEAVSIIDTISQVPLHVLDFSFTDTTRLEAQLVTAHQESARTYRVIITGIRDRSGNVIKPESNSASIDGSNQSDTTKPAMLFPFQGDSVLNVAIDRPLFFSWKEAIRVTSFERGFSLLDSAGKEHGGKYYWMNSTMLSFYPHPELSYNSQYSITIVMDSVVDMNGNGYQDSVLTKHFRTVDDRELSSISGTAIDERKEDKGKLHLVMTEVSGSEKIPRETVLDSSGRFQFNNLAEGKYAFFLFKDADSNNIRSYGNPYPFIFSEPFTQVRDTLKLRARWPLEGVNVRMK